MKKFGSKIKELLTRIFESESCIVERAWQYISKIENLNNSQDAHAAKLTHSEAGLFGVMYSSILSTINTLATRRIMVNTLFVTIFMVGLGAISYLINEFHTSIPFMLKLFLIAPAVSMIGACFVWYYNIRSYSILNHVFIMMLTRMESILALKDKPFTIAVGVMRHINKKFDLSALEKFLPFLFVVMYFVAFCVLWFW